MKSSFYVSLMLAVSTQVMGENETAPLALPATPAPALALPQQPPEKLDELLGPIALYPDALVALILPASTVPSDLVLAARYLKADGAADKLDDQGWDDSVTALARYPDVVAWLDTNLAWTKQLGEAFAAQPAEVMKAIQRLRKKARETGALTDSEQQKVVFEDDNIVIVPADPEIIYVPYYDPTIVYVQRTRYVSEPSWLTFGVGYTTGFWLGYGLDWRYQRVWCVEPRYRERYWRERHTHYHGHYRGPGYPGHRDYRNDPNYRAWRPRPGHARPPRHDENHVNRPPREISRPAPFPRDVHRSTVTGATDTRSVVGHDGTRGRGYPHRSTASVNVGPGNVTPIAPATGTPEIREPRPSPGQRPTREDRPRRPVGEVSPNRPESVSRPPQISAPPPRPERVGPPPTGRTGLPPPRESRPEPAPRPSTIDRSPSFPARATPPPVQERRTVEDRRTTEQEAR